MYVLNHTSLGVFGYKFILGIRSSVHATITHTCASKMETNGHLDDSEIPDAYLSPIESS